MPKKRHRSSRTSRRVATKTQKALLARRAAYRVCLDRRRDKMKGA